MRKLMQRYARPAHFAFLFNGDGGGGTPPAGDPPAGNPPASDPPAGDPPASDGKPAPLSEDQMSEAVKARIDKALGQARKQWEKELQDAADDEKKSAEQKANDAATKAKADADAAIAKANATLVKSAAQVAAITAGAKAERVPALLKLADLSDIEVSDDGDPDPKAVKAAIEKVLADYPEFKAGGAAPSSSGGEFGGKPATDGKPKNLAEAISKHYATS